MRLVAVTAEPNAPHVLYALLTERRPDESISHRALPTWDEHAAFVASAPYACWYLMQVDNALPPPFGDYVGAIYLTRRDEIGVCVYRAHRGCGYGPAAVRLLVMLHPRPRYIANINPANGTSIRLFRRVGMRHVAHIQNTYELVP